MFFNPQWFQPRRRAWVGSKTLTAYTLTADQGTYSISGQAASLLAGYSLPAGQGTYSIVGSDALADHQVTASQGTFSITGQDASLFRGYILPAGQGTYSIVGQDAILNPTGAFALVADTGFYTISGQDATFAIGAVPNPTDSAQLVRVRQLSWEEICRRSWGKEWTKREIAYEFSSGRKFEDALEGGPYGEID